MNEPNWDKINAKKRKEIMLGQAMNQALELLTTVFEKNKLVELTIEDGFDETYKSHVKKFFKWNQEIYDEVMKDE